MILTASTTPSAATAVQDEGVAAESADRIGALDMGCADQRGATRQSFARALALDQLKSGFGIIRDMWLAFTYIGAVLLLVARNPAWLRWLAPFGWRGRMALTTYMVQITILDLTFSHYSFDLKPTPLQALSAGLTLFAASAMLSRWWLSRFRFGPLEWLWRSLTYGRLQPWRVGSAAAAVPAE